MEYKRLTESYKGSPLHTDMEVTDGDEIYERLAELEDKIEQGTLIELPCKVGDTIYIPNNYGISFHEIERIEIYKNRIDLFFEVDTDIEYLWTYTYGRGQFSISECGTRFFLTREEAEKRFLGLQGEIKL